MNRDLGRHLAGVGALLTLLVVGCTSCSPGVEQGRPSPAPSAPAHTLAGGCAGTFATDSEPPAWAQGGWSHTNGTPWPVPWVFGTTGDAVAYLFATQLVAGASPRADGSNNKVLWEVKDHPSGADVAVEGHPLGLTQPVVKIAGGPSIVDAPTAGCWTFRLTWSANGEHSSTINLEVLPAGTVPSK